MLCWCQKLSSSSHLGRHPLSNLVPALPRCAGTGFCRRLDWCPLSRESSSSPQTRWSTATPTTPAITASVEYSSPVLSSCKLLGGIVEMYPEILPFKIRLVTLKRLHAFFGMMTYFGGLTTLTLGLFSSWFVANAHPILWKACFACPILLGCSVLIQLFRNYIWRW